MPNLLKVAMIETQILSLRQPPGWSQRRIARELGMDRETVSRHLVSQAAQQNQPMRPPAPSKQSASGVKTSQCAPSSSQAASRSQNQPMRQLRGRRLLSRG